MIEQEEPVRYFGLCSDYDGTLAHDGGVSDSTIAALKRVKASGRKLILATGRELRDLLGVFPEAGLFDRIVAENGGLLYRPASQEEKVLAESPPVQFIEELKRRGVNPLSVGHCVVSTWHPNEALVLDTIRTLGLGLQVTFNKGAVMILPAGVNKGTGMRAALEELSLSVHSVVGIGDAENDHAFLNLCECAVAVGNSLPALKDRVDFVTDNSHGAGVEELIAKLLSDDLKDIVPRLARHSVLLGHTPEGNEFRFAPYGPIVLIAGPSGGGKSTTVSAIIERLTEMDYQVCVIDPEGDYDESDHFITLGGPRRIPEVSEIFEVLNTRNASLSVNLLGVPLADRPMFFQGLLSRLQELRSQTGRPHWIVVDEAHHLLPADLDSVDITTPAELTSMALVTVHPDHISRTILRSVTILLAIGSNPELVLKQFNAGRGAEFQSSHEAPTPSNPGEIIAWPVSESGSPELVIVTPAKMELRRHRRKYATGQLGEDKSFYFRGPEGKLNLRAHNIETFTQLAEGVDVNTWTYHLQNADYSRWLRDSIKDDQVANDVHGIEQTSELAPEESRDRIIQLLRKRYTSAP
jgi:HAD superfamily hydrolase (TIGR01484 family)